MKILPLPASLCLLALAATAAGQQAPQANQGTPPGQTQAVPHGELEQPVNPYPALSPEEQARIDQVLVAWEQYSDEIHTLQGEFTRYVYDHVFGDPREPRFVDRGEVFFAAPDRGRYWVPGEQPEDWLADGVAIYRINDRTRQMEVIEIPRERRGERIVEGPLPFLFGMPAEMARERYWLHLVSETEQEFRLEARPLWQQDAANFRRAEVIVDRSLFLPAAVLIEDPSGGSHQVHVFRDAEGRLTLRVNEPIEPHIFLPPNYQRIEVPVE